jgi:hypothetical protein
MCLDWLSLQLAGQQEAIFSEASRRKREIKHFLNFGAEIKDDWIVQSFFLHKFSEMQSDKFTSALSLSLSHTHTHE